MTPADVSSIEEFTREISSGCAHIQLWDLKTPLKEEDISQIVSLTKIYSQTFSHLGFFRCRFGDGQLKHLCGDICPTVRHLLFQHSLIRDEGMKEIAELVVRSSIKLERLFVCDDVITDEGVKILSKALERNSSLNFLCLTENDVSEVGFNYLFEMLKWNTTISRISFSGNRNVHLKNSGYHDMNRLTYIASNLPLRLDWQRMVAFCMHHIKHDEDIIVSTPRSLPVEILKMIKALLFDL